MKLGMPALYEFNCIEENIKLAKELVLDFIEINLNFSYCREAILNIEHLDKLLTENELEATLHFLDEADFGTYDEIREPYIVMFEKFVKSASKSKRIKQINIHLNSGPVVSISGVRHYVYEKEYNDFLTRLLDSLEKLNNIVNEYKIGLVIENINIPTYLRKTYLTLNSLNYNFCFDIGHDYVDKCQLLELAKEYDFKFKEFHIHNSDGFKNHFPLNKGILDINYYKRMALIHDAYIVVEVKCIDDLRASIPLFKTI